MSSNSLSFRANVRRPHLLDRKLLNSSLGLGVVLDGRAPLLHGRVGREVDVAKAGDADPGPEGEVGDGGAVECDKARSARLLLLELLLEDLVKARGFAFEAGEGGLLRSFAVGSLPVVY